MRSRDGNYPKLLSALLLAAIASPLAADAYIISYRATVKNAQLQYEKISLSRAMTPCRGTPQISKLLLHVSTSRHLPTIINQNRETFLTYIQTQNLHVKSSVSQSNNSYRDITTLTLPPHCFMVTINESFAIISAFK
ncbi:MAG: hypothetical protein DSZ03_06790 [Sulfurimonas sp.]|nr:MAG: hypothetical protein DSZ03_06790 [Sulfurimonas sp.]